MIETLISDCLKSGCFVRFRMPGRSMHPTIRHNEMVILAPVKTACIVLGDILLSRCGEKLTAHRLVRVEPNGMSEDRSALSPGQSMVILRGDACNASDAPIPERQIIGRVVAVERRGRLLNPYGLHSELTRRIYLCGIRLKSLLRRAGDAFRDRWGS
jgi:hypothetical protein